MTSPQNRDPDQPSEKRLGKAAIVVVAIVAAVIVVTFVGMNVSHKQQIDKEHATGKRETSGGLH